MNPHVVPFIDILSPELPGLRSIVDDLFQQLLGQHFLVRLVEWESRHGQIHLAEKSAGSDVRHPFRMGCPQEVDSCLGQMLHRIFQIRHDDLLIDLPLRTLSESKGLFGSQGMDGSRYISEESYQVEIGQGADEAGLGPILVLDILISEIHVLHLINERIG